MSSTGHFMVTVWSLASQVSTTFWISSGSEQGAFNRARQLIGEPCELLEISSCGRPASHGARPGALVIPIQKHTALKRLQQSLLTHTGIPNAGGFMTGVSFGVARRATADHVAR